MIARIECEYGFSASKRFTGAESIERTVMTAIMPASSETTVHVVVLLPGGDCEVTRMVPRLDV